MKSKQWEWEAELFMAFLWGLWAVAYITIHM